ncbi:hypothetical protein LINPERHAP1_LOCUS27349 [Linum perenne]
MPMFSLKMGLLQVISRCGTFTRASSDDIEPSKLDGPAGDYIFVLGVYCFQYCHHGVRSLQVVKFLQK